MRRPHGFEQFIEKQGFHAIYLVTSDHSAFKVGIAEDPISRLGQLQTANFLPLRLHRFWWLPGPAISRRIESAFKEHFAAWNIRGEWFDFPMAEAEAFIEGSIRTLGTWGITDAEMIELMDHFARRKYSLPPEAPSPLRGMPSEGARGGA